MVDGCRYNQQSDMADIKLTGKTSPGKVLSGGGLLFGNRVRRMGLNLMSKLSLNHQPTYSYERDYSE
jgi:hypothetical protein